MDIIMQQIGTHQNRKPKKDQHKKGSAEEMKHPYPE